MAKLFVLGMILLICAVSAEETPEKAEGGGSRKHVDLILELTNENFDEMLKKNRHIIIFFFNSDCERCKEELQEFLSAAKILRSTGARMTFGMVHGGKQKELVDRLGIKRYPNIRLVNNGDFSKAFEYKYVGQKGYNVLRWLTKLAEPVRTIDDADELNEVTHKHSIPIGFFRDINSTEAVAYQTVAKVDEDTKYGIMTNTTVLDDMKINVNARIIYYKADGSQDVYDGPWDTKSIRVFVDAFSLPSVVVLSHDTVSLLHRTVLKKQAILFASNQSADFDSLYAAFETVAKRFRGKLVFIYNNLDDNEDQDRLRNAYGIKPSDGAQFRIGFTASGDKLEKFKPAKLRKLDVDSMSKFVEEVLESKVEKYTLEQPLPQDWDAKPLKVLVSSNFDKVTSDQSKAVLVFFTTPWCSSCPSLEDMVREVAQQLRNKDDVLIGIIDCVQNELESLNVRHGFPVVRLYPKNEQEPIDYHGDKSVSGLRVFVESNGKDIQRKRRTKDEL